MCAFGEAIRRSRDLVGCRDIKSDNVASGDEVAKRLVSLECPVVDFYRKV